MIELFLSLLIAEAMDTTISDQPRPLSPEEREAQKRKGEALIEASYERAAQEALDAYKAGRAQPMKQPGTEQLWNGWRASYEAVRAEPYRREKR